jgi:hypothetical protein
MAIFFLRKGPPNLKPISDGNSIRELLGSVLFFFDDKTFSNTLLKLSSALVDRLPAFELSVDIDENFSDVLTRIDKVVPLLRR